MNKKMKQLTLTGVLVLLLIGIMGFTKNDKPTEAEYIKSMQTIAKYQESEKVNAATTKENNTTQTEKYAIFTYTITDVTYKESPENDEYTGKAEDGTGIFFNSDYVTTVGQIKVGDTVTAYFDPKNTEDGLLFVRKN